MKRAGLLSALSLLATLAACAALGAASQAQPPAGKDDKAPAAAPALVLPPSLPDFDLVTTLEAAPRPTRQRPARPGRVFDGPVTREEALAAWRGGSLVAFYDYGVNCSTVVEPACDKLGVVTVMDPSGFIEERTVIDPTDPVFLVRFGVRIGAELDRLRPRRKDLLAAHIDNIGLIADPGSMRVMYGAARAEFARRNLAPLFVIKNSMRGHEQLFADGSLKAEEAAYLVCENCLSKVFGAELEAALRIARLLGRPLVLMEFGKAKWSWQDATLEEAQRLALRMAREGLVGFVYWGPDESRYEFTRRFPGAQAAASSAGGRTGR